MWIYYYTCLSPLYIYTNIKTLNSNVDLLLLPFMHNLYKLFMPLNSNVDLLLHICIVAQTEVFENSKFQCGSIITKSCNLFFIQRNCSKFQCGSIITVITNVTCSDGHCSKFQCGSIITMLQNPETLLEYKL